MGPSFEMLEQKPAGTPGAATFDSHRPALGAGNESCSSHSNDPARWADENFHRTTENEEFRYRLSE